MLALKAEAWDAVQRLKHNPDWQVFTEALTDHMVKVMHIAIDAGADRDMVCGYARGIRDVVATIETYERGTDRGGKPQRPDLRAKPRREVSHVV